MRETIDLKLRPEQAADEQFLEQKIASRCGCSTREIDEWRLLRRSIDARGRQPLIHLRVEVFRGEKPRAEPALLDSLKQVDDSRRALIVGAGPAGYFAALEMLELGIKPLVLDRGKDVRSRRRDLRSIQQFGEVNPHSNYCFGEGGAGTYSDGKLYTRSHKRGTIDKAMRLLVEHGAKSDILVDAHPHIGSNKLPGIVANIRETILAHGGEVHFGHHVTDLLIEKGEILGVVVNEEKEYRAGAVVLATGHSARDIYYLLREKGVRLEAKPFALGVRVEHPQSLIDAIQYNQRPRDRHLPAASYRLACQVDGRGVFSFCMCPGGLVVPAATAPGEIVVNGMSLSRRDSPYANSGVVVALEEDDSRIWGGDDVFAGLEFQKSVERGLFEYGSGDQKAPAQRLTDFLAGKISADLPDSSYIPGLYSAPLHDLLPPFIYRKLRAGIRQFERRMKGYYTSEAKVIATESRTSSPVRIPRNEETYMHEDIRGLFPCGEGAGYAGGIISAAMDGQNVGRALARFLS